ncbi:FecR family protein [Paraburkholderia fungorum]|uniref:FecR family protein n=1 Tax=Paraburkholderia fungorum TaxID=134537 RepID=A0A1H1HSB5_9BURK|nr:FecR family protein [Paraburkholderia fungorum]
MTFSVDEAVRGTVSRAGKVDRRGGLAAAWLGVTAAGVIAMGWAPVSAQAQVHPLAQAQSKAAYAPKHRSGSQASSYASYTTHDGDTLYEIADRYLTDSNDWALLSRLNHVPAPRRMPAGITLLLPVVKLKQDPESARVIATSGPVEHAFGNHAYVPVTQATTLGEGDRIRTGPNGFVTLELPDGSHVTVAHDGELDIGVLRRTTLTGVSDRIFNLRHGEVESQVTHATRKDDRFQIRSPSVVAGVRGTRFRVAYNGDAQSTNVEVIEGAVGVDPSTPGATGRQPAAALPGVPLQASAQLVKASFGNVTRTGGTVGEPVELLPPPALVKPGRVLDGATVAFDLVPSAQAVGYRVQIARDADQLDLIRDLRVGEPHADIGDLPDGTYFVRLFATDSRGLDGLPQVYAFERRRFDLSASATQRAGSRDYEFRWLVGRTDVETRFRFVLGTTADLLHPIVDRTDLADGQLVVSDLPAGVYYWTIVGEQFDNGRFYETSSPIRSFTLAH